MASSLSFQIFLISWFLSLESQHFSISFAPFPSLLNLQVWDLLPVQLGSSHCTGLPCPALTEEEVSSFTAIWYTMADWYPREDCPFWREMEEESGWHGWAGEGEGEVGRTGRREGKGNCGQSGGKDQINSWININKLDSLCYYGWPWSSKLKWSSCLSLQFRVILVALVSYSQESRGGWRCGLIRSLWCYRWTWHLALSLDSAIVCQLNTKLHMSGKKESQCVVV